MHLQNIIDAADGYNMDVNIKKVLSGMGFAQDTWTKNIAVLSGGELTRLRLAKLLLEKPDVLILDEPTNHLDFATMEWLENYLKGYSGAVLVVSHDRYFLDNICTRTWEVSFQTMTAYKGNFSAYLPQKEACRCPAPEAARCRCGAGRKAAGLCRPQSCARFHHQDGPEPPQTAGKTGDHGSTKG